MFSESEKKNIFSEPVNTDLNMVKNIPTALKL